MTTHNGNNYVNKRSSENLVVITLQEPVISSRKQRLYQLIPIASGENNFQDKSTPESSASETSTFINLCTSLKCFEDR